MFSLNKYMNTIILLRKCRPDKTFTIYTFIKNNLSQRTGYSCGSVFPVARQKKETRPYRNHFFSTNFIQKVSLLRGRPVNPLLLLHYLMKISIIIHKTINAILQLHSGNNNLEK